MNPRCCRGDTKFVRSSAVGAWQKCTRASTTDSVDASRSNFCGPISPAIPRSTRLKREAQSAAGLNHPGIVAVYDSGEEDFVETGGSSVSVPFIVMEYVEGQTLREVLNEHGTLTIDEALNVVAGVLAPLEYSHRNGIVHRDIKPANVMLTPEGDIKVMDFGIARALKDNSGLTQTQSVVGTAQYLSPEQARGEVVDARSDLYSTACLLYELLVGRPRSSVIRSSRSPTSTWVRRRSLRASTIPMFPRGRSPPHAFPAQGPRRALPGRLHLP